VTWRKNFSRHPTTEVLNIKCLASELLFQVKNIKRCPYINKKFNDFLQNHKKYMLSYKNKKYHPQ
jgi:uncharacterized CHY-type Zn-finger protein